MSVRVMARVWAHSRQKGGELLIMLALADFANDEGECWPYIGTLAAKARLTERQVQKLLPQLERAGEIQRLKSSGGRNRPHRFFVTVTENGEQNSMKKVHRTRNGEKRTVNSVTRNGELEFTRIEPSGTVNKGARTKRARNEDADPRVRTLLTAFCEKYQNRVGAAYVVSGGKDTALLKGILSAGHDVAAVLGAMDRYFADDFHGKNGFNVGRFRSAFPALISAGVRQRPNYDEGAFPAA